MTQLVDKSTNLDRALAYLKRGFSIFPVHHPSMGKWKGMSDHDVGKRPLDDWKEYQERLPTEAEVRAWWSRWPSANIGLACGALSRVFVVDADGPAAVEWMGKKFGFLDTLQAHTRRGIHFYFLHPGFEVRNGVSVVEIGDDQIDIRGDGGYVVLPPSTHASGFAYDWADEDAKPAVAPEWLVAFLKERQAKSGGRLSRHDLTELLQGAPAGRRHDSLVRLAGHWFGRGLPPEEVDLLCQAWNKGNRPPSPPEDISRRVQSVYEMHLRNRAGERRPTGPDFSDMISKVIPERGWLREWVDFADRITEAPRDFLFFCGLVTLAVAAGNHVFAREAGDAKIFPNLWVCVLGPSSISAKSTSVNMARRLLAIVAEGLAAPDSFSIEALQEYIRDHPATLLVQDELGSFLANMRSDYAAGTVELLTRAYDYHAEIVRFTKSGGELTIREPAISFLTASTLEWFKSNLREADIRGGFIARFGFCYSEGTEKVIPWRDDGPTVKVPVGTLRKVAELKDAQMEFPPETRSVYTDWYRDRSKEWRSKDLLSHFWGRYRTIAKKAAMLFTLAEDPDERRVSPDSMGRACALVDYHLACVDHLLTHEVTFDRSLDIARRVEKFLARRGSATRKQILQGVRNLTASSLNAQVLPHLMQSGKIRLDKGRYVYTG